MKVERTRKPPELLIFALTADNDVDDVFDQNICRKLQVHSKSEAVAKALRNKLV